MTIVAETSCGGQRILIPTSIFNGGAKAAADKHAFGVAGVTPIK